MGTTKPRRLGPEYADYVIELDDWKWSYSLYLTHKAWAKDPLDEYRHLDIEGRLLSPSTTKGDRATVAVMSKLELDEASRTGAEHSKSLGYIEKRQALLNAYLTVPPDAQASLLTVLACGKLKYLTLSGFKLRYRQSSIRGCRFEGDVGLENLPLEHWD